MILATSLASRALAQVHAEQTHACGLRPYGRGVFWRSNIDVQLIDTRRFIEVTPGFNFCCGLTADPRAWCSDNSYGLPVE